MDTRGLRVVICLYLGFSVMMESWSLRINSRTRCAGNELVVEIELGSRVYSVTIKKKPCNPSIDFGL